MLCKEFVSVSNGGKIINLTSGQSLGTMPDELPYTMTKASIDMLTQQLAPEMISKGITINAYDPGPTDTGWMTNDVKEQILLQSSTGIINTPESAARDIIEILSKNGREKIKIRTLQRNIQTTKFH